MRQGRKSLRNVIPDLIGDQIFEKKCALCQNLSPGVFYFTAEIKTTQPMTFILVYLLCAISFIPEVFNEKRK